MTLNIVTPVSLKMGWLLVGGASAACSGDTVVALHPASGEKSVHTRSPSTLLHLHRQQKSCLLQWGSPKSCTNDNHIKLTSNSHPKQ